MDASESIEYITRNNQPNWPLVMTMLRTLVDVINSNSTLGNQSRLGMLRFHGRVVRGDEPGVAWIHEHLSLSSNADLAGVRSAIDELANETPAGGTYMLEAIERAVAELASNVRRNGRFGQVAQGIILFTDGRPNTGTKERVLELFQNQMDIGVNVVLIGKH